MNNIIFVTGYKYSGKTTICRKLIEFGQFSYFSTGDYCRSIKMPINDYLGIDSQKVSSAISKHIYENIFHNHILIDGYPRTGEQVEYIKKYFPHSLILILKLGNVDTARQRCLKRQESFDESKYLKDTLRIDQLIPSLIHNSLNYRIIYPPINESDLRHLIFNR